MTGNGGHAVVIGASLAGMLSARVLTDHFERVTIVERDTLQVGAEARRGVPQAKHPHILFEGGRRIMDELLPGMSEALVDAGAVTVSLPDDLLLHTRPGWLNRTKDSGVFETLSFSRPLLDLTVQSKVVDLPGIEVLERHEAVGLLSGDGGATVSGVRLRPRPSEDGEVSGGGPRDLTADLVVDASGRSSKTPRWLAELGLPEPELSRVSVNPGYATRVFRRAGPFDGWKSMIILAHPGSPRGGVLMPMEDGRWIASLNGMGTDHPPTDEDGFLEFARSLPTPLLHDTVKGCEPLGPVLGYRHGDNVHHRYEKLAAQPDGLLVTGDAFRSFNPIYGQGMTVTAIGAKVLGECLRTRAGSGLAGLTKDFQRRLAKASEPAWRMATGSDMAHPVAEGPARPAPERVISRYVRRVENAAVLGGPVTRAFLRVMQMVSSPAVLFRPDVVFRVLRDGGKSAPTPHGLE
ncbi:MAG: NAD(P)/FAD-dependent oxidoreductase [Actinophytocola sp.]|uniref:NAD(P)/FAD-dependent oxidoreductase n=1 Tax=Actinophytocola sp. TaxID=1872138 RepID=UPI003D6BD261